MTAFDQFCVYEDGGGAIFGKLRLFNYCDEPAYDMNDLVLEIYRYLGMSRERHFHFPYWLAYCDGKCHDLFTLVLRRKFCQNTYFVGSNITETDFISPISLKEGLRTTIKDEFVNKVQGHTFHRK